MNKSSASRPLGSQCLGRLGVSFCLWAPWVETVHVKIIQSKKTALFPLKKNKRGYFSGIVASARANDLYFYILNGTKQRPDPAARFQPRGVHGPSQIIDFKKFEWQDKAWKGIELKDAIFYELHVGTFTPKGTFEAAIGKLSYLKKLGVNCIELMPIAQFPGKRNWGYDGVGLYAVQNSYGGPAGLKKFVRACHEAGMAVCLDVVYNHFGPEGNYLNDFGPYFTSKYHTPWGQAVNYDDDGNREVRRFVMDSALYWIREFHFDSLRLDAVHGIYDSSRVHLLQELNAKVQSLAKQLQRKVHIIAESDLNDSKLIRPKKSGGYGLIGQWSDDFHHAVHALLTGEKKGYYADFGRIQDVAKAFKAGFVYDGNYSAFRKKKHGNSVKDLAREKLVVCVQNHDQIGNRAWGDRLSVLTSFEKMKVAAALLLLGPNTPMLFMGEEYGEKAPFQYFIDHSDQALIKAVQEGRKREFVSFGWKTVPDPAAVKTFNNSKLKWGQLSSKRSKQILALYRDLIKIRKKIFSENRNARSAVHVAYDAQRQSLSLTYPSKSGDYVVLFSLSSGKPIKTGSKTSTPVKLLLNTSHSKYGGPQSSPSCFASVAQCPRPLRPR